MAGSMCWWVSRPKRSGNGLIVGVLVVQERTSSRPALCRGRAHSGIPGFLYRRRQAQSSPMESSRQLLFGVCDRVHFEASLQWID